MTSLVEAPQHVDGDQIFPSDMSMGQPDEEKLQLMQERRPSKTTTQNMARIYEVTEVWNKDILQLVLAEQMVRDRGRERLDEFLQEVEINLDQRLIDDFLSDAPGFILKSLRELARREETYKERLSEKTPKYDEAQKNFSMDDPEAMERHKWYLAALVLAIGKGDMELTAFVSNWNTTILGKFPLDEQPWHIVYISVVKALREKVAANKSEPKEVPLPQIVADAPPSVLPGDFSQVEGYQRVIDLPESLQAREMLPAIIYPPASATAETTEGDTAATETDQMAAVRLSEDIQSDVVVTQLGKDAKEWDNRNKVTLETMRLNPKPLTPESIIICNNVLASQMTSVIKLEMICIFCGFPVAQKEAFEKYIYGGNLSSTMELKVQKLVADTKYFDPPAESSSSPETI